MRDRTGLHRANWQCCLALAIGAFAATAPIGVVVAQPAATPQSPGASPIILNHDDYVKAVAACHNLALLAIQHDDIDAQNVQQDAEVNCNHDAACIQKAAAAYALAKNGFDVRKNKADATFAKENLDINYLFSGAASRVVNLNSLPANLQSMYQTPPEAWDCNALQSELDPTQ